MEIFNNTLMDEAPKWSMNAFPTGWVIPILLTAS
jgi:hypothetical protein